jgi:ABC-type transport system involved in cytochrome bd biosynthesis fused ATPase/permease subunit
MFDHLSETTLELTRASTAERMRAVHEDRWVDYPRADFLLDVLNATLNHPRTTRMPSVAIYADSGMGKTRLVQRILEQHKATFDRTTRIEKTPIISIQMSAKPRRNGFIPRSSIPLALRLPRAPA